MILSQIKKDLEQSRKLLSSMTQHIEKEMILSETNVSFWNEKDSILSAHSRIIQLQVKLIETEIRFKQEEVKLKKMKQELQLLTPSSNAHETETLPPLAQEEWDALFHAFERHQLDSNDIEETIEKSDYAVLLK